MPRRRPLKFMLEPDGTHGVVEPWVPPDGVALEVLCDVRAGLLDVLRREGAALARSAIPALHRIASTEVSSTDHNHGRASCSVILIHGCMQPAWGICST